MVSTEFEKLCRKIADVPWEIDIESGFLRASYDAQRPNGYRQISLFEEGVVSMWLNARGDTLRLRTPTGTPSPHQIDAARAFFGTLELEYIAREIAPNAPWVADQYTAKICEWFGIIRHPHRDGEPWVMCIGESWLHAPSVDGLIAAYREHRREHDAARGVKTRKPKPAPTHALREKPSKFDSIRYTDDITAEHARNVLMCMADPSKYTHIATWAKRHPLQAAQVLRRALEVL